MLRVERRGASPGCRRYCAQSTILAREYITKPSVFGSAPRDTVNLRLRSKVPTAWAPSESRSQRCHHSLPTMWCTTTTLGGSRRQDGTTTQTPMTLSIFNCAEILRMRILARYDLIVRGVSDAFGEVAAACEGLTFCLDWSCCFLELSKLVTRPRVRGGDEKYGPKEEKEIWRARIRRDGHRSITQSRRRCGC